MRPRWPHRPALRRGLVCITGLLFLAPLPALAAPHGTEAAAHVADATEPHGSATHTTGAHDAAAGHEGSEHGGDAHGHYDWTGDDDGDGIANWRDATTYDEPNEHYVVDDVGFHAVNLLILLGILYYVARRPLRDGLRERSTTIRRDLTTAARLRDEARQRHEELGARLEKFEQELATMRAEAVAEAREEEAKLIERARTEAEHIRENAQRNIRDEVARARYALRAEAVDLAIQLAEGTLRDKVGRDDQQRLAQQFLDALGTSREGVSHG